jgi:hypothetical protein
MLTGTICVSLQVAVLQQLQSVAHVPTLHATGELQGLHNTDSLRYILMSPIGQHIGSDSDLILKAASHVAAVISEMQRKGLLHRSASYIADDALVITFNAIVALLNVLSSQSWLSVACDACMLRNCSSVAAPIATMLRCARH